MDIKITLTPEYQEKIERLAKAYEIPVDRLIKKLLSEEIKDVYAEMKNQDDEAFQVMVHSCVHPDEVQFVRTWEDLSFYQMAW
jgi:uncharacterized protein YgbK (DUF1537 family)